MKNFIKSFIGISLFASLAYAASTFTTNYNLEKPSDGSTQWGAAIRNNFDAIDSQMFINAGSIQNHIIDATDAHDASAISSVTPPPGFCTGGVNNVQEELDCFEDQINAIVGGGAVTIATNQTITGQKTFTQQLITQAGILNSSGITNTGGIVTSGALTFNGLTSGVLKVDGSSLVSASSIVDSDVNAAAAIARTKLASGTADHVLINNGTGVMSSEAILSFSRGGTGVASFTPGAIQFGGASGLVEDPTLLFWDNTNNRLAVGNASPTHSFDNSGVSRFRSSYIIDGRDESSAATINALSPTQGFVKLTSTVTTINGIDSTNIVNGYVLKIHNDTGSTVTLSHNSGSASANDRLRLPNGLNYSLRDDETVELMYSINGTSRWVTSTPSLAIDSVSPLTTKGDVLTYSTQNVRLPVGTDGQVLTADSAQATGLKWSSATAPESSYDINNLGAATSVAANALTVALKDKSGSDPSGASPVKIGFRNSSLTNGTFVTRTVTSALSLVISSGSTLGHQNSTDRYIYVYAIDNAGTVKLAVSSAQYDDNSLVTTVAEGGAGAADSNSAIYSDAVYTNVASRLIGILVSNQTTAGTWATNMSSIEVNPVKLPAIVARVSMSANQTLSNATNTKLSIDTQEVVDRHGLFQVANNRIIVNKTGKYRITGKVMSTANTTTISLFDCQIWKNASVIDSATVFKGTDGNTLNTLVTANVDAVYDLVADDYIELYGFQVSGGNFDVLSSSPSQLSYLGVEYLGK